MDNELLDAELGPVLNWTPALTPPMTPLTGRFVRLEKLVIHSQILKCTMHQLRDKCS